MSDPERDHLLLGRSEEPMTEERVLPFLRQLEGADALVGSAETVAGDWADATVGCVVVKGEPSMEGAPFADWDQVAFPEGLVRDGEALKWGEEPPGLPAAPLVVKRGRDWAFVSAVDVELDFDAADEAHYDLLEELTELFLESYRGEGVGALEGAALAEREGGGRTLALQGWTPPDPAVARAHLHWWIEEVARFLPLAEARILPKRVARGRGLAPSWIGPLLVIGASFATRLLDPELALRAGCLVWGFGALAITFLSRAHVGKITWTVAVLNALAQSAFAFLVVRPDLLVGAPTGESTEALLEWSEAVRTTLEWVLYASGAVGLVWVLTYLGNRRRPL